LLPRGLADLGCEVSTSVDEVIPKVDVINMLRIQFERLTSPVFPSVREYASLYGLNPRRFSRAKPGVLVMHPGPINRGIEIDSEVADGPSSAILAQVSHGLAVRMAALLLVTTAHGPAA
jgi:aspartate carbamoyltransferase catalytic subunit